MAALEPCPACGAGGAQTKNSRPHRLGRLRHRACVACGHRWRTVEMDADVADSAFKALSQVREAMQAMRDIEATLLTLRPVPDGLPQKEIGGI